MLIGDVILQCRKTLGIKQITAAHRIGVCVVTYRSWEKGYTVPRRGQLTVISTVFGFDLRELKRLQKETRITLGKTWKKTNLSSLI